MRAARQSYLKRWMGRLGSGGVWLQQLQGWCGLWWWGPMWYLLMGPKIPAGAPGYPIQSVVNNSTMLKGTFNVFFFVSTSGSTIYQWRLVPFKMREDHFFFSWARTYFYSSILDDCRSYSIHPVQRNIDRVRLLRDTHIFHVPVVRLLQPS